MFRRIFIALIPLVGLSFLLTSSACSRHPRRSGTLPASCKSAKGSIHQLRTRTGVLDLYGFPVRIGAPQRCGLGHSFDVTASGHRRFSRKIMRWRQLCPASMPKADCAKRCLGRPGPDDPCTVVSAYHLALEAMQQLRAADHLASVGLAGCGERSNEPGFGRVTLIVYDWAAADLALRALGGRMRAWRAGGRLRVAVKPIACGVAL